MKQFRSLELGFLHASGAVAYIAIVAFIMTRAEEVIRPFEGSLLPPLLFLTLFVLSVAVMALTIFGRPVFWFLEGKKKEAMMLTVHTVLFLAVLVGLIFTFVLAVGGEVFGTQLN